MYDVRMKTSKRVIESVETFDDALDVVRDHLQDSGRFTVEVYDDENDVIIPLPKSFFIVKDRVPTETSRVNTIIRWLKTLDMCAYEKRVGSIYQSGAADLSGCVSGRHFEFEVKRSHKEKPRDQQLAWLKRWKEAGAVTGVVVTVEDCKKSMKEAGICYLTYKDGTEEDL